MLPVLLQQLFVSCSQQRVRISWFLCPDFPLKLDILQLDAGWLSSLGRATCAALRLRRCLLPAPHFEGLSSPSRGASQGLRHAATEAVAELVENWQPPEEGEGCIYQSLGSMLEATAGSQ